MLDLTGVELMRIIWLASKAAEFENEFVKSLFPNEVNMAQVKAAIDQIIPILAKLDRENLGLMPVPHDGVQWKDRVE